MLPPPSPPLPAPLPSLPALLFRIAGGLQALYVIAELVRVFDIFLEFRIGYKSMDSSEIILDRRLISRRYLSRHFVTDVSTGFVVDIINCAFFGWRSNLLTFLTIIKLAEVPAFFRIANSLRPPLSIGLLVRRYPSITRLLKVVLLFTIIIHVVGCVYWRFHIFLKHYYYEIQADDSALEENCDPDTLRYVGSSGDFKFCRFTDLFGPPDEITANAFDATSGQYSVVKPYGFSLYWAVLVILGNSVGASTVFEVVFTGIVTMVGMLVFAVIIGSASSIITSMDSETDQHLEQMNAVNSYMAFRDVPPWMQERIRGKKKWRTIRCFVFLFVYKKSSSSLPSKNTTITFGIPGRQSTTRKHSRIFLRCCACSSLFVSNAR